MATVETLLRTGTDRLRAAGSETPRLDSELLLGHAIGAERTVLLAHSEAEVSEPQRATFEAGLRRRADGEPVAYIRGFKEFFGIALSVDSRALIPRPETELLVELAEREVMSRLTGAPRPQGAQALRLVDVGTGAGTIAVALAVALRRRRCLDDVEIVATDVSPDALELARENAVGHGVADRMRFIEADLLPPVISIPYPLVLANLPYVASGAIARLPVAASFEPRVALDGGLDGLTVTRRLVERLPEALAADGVAFLEIGSDQEQGIRRLVDEVLPGATCQVERDLAGHPRVARIGSAIPRG